MTRNHYEAIAYRMAMLQTNATPACAMLWRQMIEALADVFEKDNGNFKRKKFFEACERDYWDIRKVPEGA